VGRKEKAAGKWGVDARSKPKSATKKYQKELTKIVICRYVEFLILALFFFKHFHILLGWGRIIVIRYFITTHFGLCVFILKEQEWWWWWWWW